MSTTRRRRVSLGRIDIAQRPQVVAGRSRFGNWGAMCCSVSPEPQFLMLDNGLEMAQFKKLKSTTGMTAWRERER